MRICARGHHNPRHVQFCTQCGSADLSTPTPPGSLLHHLSGAALYALVFVTITLVVASAALAALHAIDWQAISEPLLSLLVMLGLLYWTTTWLPGPVRKLSKAAGKQAMKLVRNKKERKEHGR